MFTTISLEKKSVNISHSLGLVVNVRTGKIELFESRGADLSNKTHPPIRRHFYTQAAFNKLHNTIVHRFFKNNRHMKGANLEARMVRNKIPFPTTYTAQPMLQMPVMLTADSACRKGVLTYIYYRVKNPRCSRYQLYKKIKHLSN